MPHPARNTRSPLCVRLYAAPIRGATFPKVVAHKVVPAVARAIFAGSPTSSQAASVVLPRADGAGFISQRRPYVRVSLGVIFQVSCPYSEKDCVRMLAGNSRAAYMLPTPVGMKFCTLGESKEMTFCGALTSRKRAR